MEKEKFIDESWKETASADKEKLEKATRNIGKDQQSTESPSGRGPSQNEQVSQNEPAQQNASSSDESEGLQLNFQNYVTSLGFQAMIFMGEIPNPVTNETEKNLEQAKFLIDTLVMLREKTKGNLISKEEDVLNTTIYELQMKYIEANKNEASNPN